MAKLWSLCHILRDDGVTYQDYVTELTYLLFLKMMEETGRESLIPSGYRWKDLVDLEGEHQLTHYRRMLLDLGDPENRDVRNDHVRAIFADAQTSLRKPANLKALTGAIDRLDWFSAREEGLGNLYEGLLEKNAAEKKSGAGQYFTPRPLIDCIVRLIAPKPGEIIQDPAAGTGGFIVAADQFIKLKTDNLYKLTEEQQYFQRTQAYTGLELVPDTHRLCLMNLLLHGIDGGITCGDTLSPDGEALPKADIIMTNPPFGTKKGGGRPIRSDFSITADTSNKQLAFIEHIYRALKTGGRAAVIVPDNVLFEENTGRRLRQQLMEHCNLHTILRLPTGIFYAQGIKTNVLFFERSKTESNSTKEVFVFDMRAGMSTFGKTKPIDESDFKEFELCYRERNLKLSSNEDSRFKKFTREEIHGRGDNLDIVWLRDDTANEEELYTEPADIAAAIAQHLRCALDEVNAVCEELEEINA